MNYQPRYPWPTHPERRALEAIHLALAFHDPQRHLGLHPETLAICAVDAILWLLRAHLKDGIPDERLDGLLRKLQGVEVPIVPVGAGEAGAERQAPDEDNEPGQLDR
jgi:hypothetical protein